MSAADPVPEVRSDRRARAEATLTWREARTYADAIAEARATAAAAPARIVERLLAADAVVFTGAGSSYYLARTIAWAWREAVRRPATAEPLSEVLLRPVGAVGPQPARVAVVVISRSGETSEAVAAARWAGSVGAATLAITCRAASPLAQVSEAVLVPRLGDERAIVMTRSFTSMLALALGVVARAAAGVAGEVEGQERGPSDGAETASDRGRGAHALEGAVSTEIDRAWDLALAQPWSRVVFLGGGARHGLALEARLKVTEMSQLPADAYEPLEFRHGPISVCEPGVLVVGVLGGDAADEERRVVEESAALGATTWLPDLGAAGATAEDLPWTLPPLQALAIGIAVARGLDPDAPRHLSQVVVLP